MHWMKDMTVDGNLILGSSIGHRGHMYTTYHVVESLHCATIGDRSRPQGCFKPSCRQQQRLER